jgi:hypothetical protein
MRSVSLLILLLLLAALSGCFARERWVRANLFSTVDAAKSVKAVEATIDSIAFPGGIQRGINVTLDEQVATDQGLTKSIYLEQPVELPTSIILLKRVRVHFDEAGSPLFIERIEPAISP